MTNIFGDGELTTQYPVYDDIFSLYDNVSGFFNKIRVDDGAIEIDHAGHTGNVHDSHITLKGNLESHEAFFKIKNAQNTELFRITHAGHLLAPQDITAPSITNNTNAVVANQTGINTNSGAIISNDTDIQANATNTTALQTLTKINVDAVQATSLATDKSLVQRNNTGDGTMFTILNANLVEVNHQVTLYGDSQLWWEPTNTPGSFIRVGRTQYSGNAAVGDGIELVGPAMDVGKRNEVRITANDTAPSIDLQCNKTNNAPFIRCTDKDDIVQIEISDQGLVQPLTNSSYLEVTPGIDFTALLKTGQVRHIIGFAVPWSDDQKELVFILTTPNEDYEEKFFFSCEVSLNENTPQGVYTQSVVYVDRVSKNLRQSAPSQIRVVMKLELLKNLQGVMETGLTTEHMLDFTYNNQKMLV